MPHKLTGLTSPYCVGTALHNTLLREDKGRGDEEKDASSYWMTLWKKEINGTFKWKH
jgi:hypothetical protein